MSRFSFTPLAVGIVLVVAFLAFAGGFVVDVFQMGQDASLANDIKTVVAAIHDYQMFNGGNLPSSQGILALTEGQNSTPFGQVAVSEGNSVIVQLTGKQFIVVVGTSSSGNVLTFNSEVGSISSTRN